MTETRSLTNDIFGIALKVHEKLGNCFSAVIYKDALAREFSLAGISFKRNVETPVYYGDDPLPLDTLYIADFMIMQSVIVMVHTGDSTDPFDLISMLQATEKNLAIDLEFGKRKVRFKKAYRNSKFINSFNYNSENEISNKNVDFERVAV
jgi:GxxExxY protein